MCGTVPGALGFPSPDRYYPSQKCHPLPSALSATFREIITNLLRYFCCCCCFVCLFFLFTRLSLPTTHNPAPAIYPCQLALIPARHPMPLLVSRRQPVCTKWCHPRVRLLSWFQSLQQTTGRQWSERLQPRGFPSKFFLFPSTTRSWHRFPQEGISEKNLSTCDSDIDLFGYAVQDKSQDNLRCVYWNRYALCCSFMFHNGKVGKAVTSYKHEDVGTARMNQRSMVGFSYINTGC